MKSFLKKLFSKKPVKSVENYEYKYFFKYETSEIVARARAINAVAIEAASQLPVLMNLLGQPESLSDDTASQVDDAIKATALSIEVSMTAFSTVIKLAGDSDYRKVQND